MFYFIFILVSIYTLFTLAFAITSFKEGYIRAGILGTVFFFAMAAVLGIYGFFKGAGLLSTHLAQGIQIGFGVILTLFSILMFIPLGRNPKAILGTEGMADGKSEKFNQKDTAFSLAHVGGYGPEAAKRRWAVQSRDRFGGIFWTLVMELRGHVDGKTNSKKKNGFSSKDITREIKSIAKYLGADLVGITTVKDDFTYSNCFSYEESKLGVGPAVTTPVDLKHKYVIVLAKEMNYSVVKDALTEKDIDGLGIGEVGKSYYEVAQTACALAAYIRHLGYPARAHHLRHDQIIHVPHAVDAGLGEQGRHSYLITYKYGPRVRTAAVTTDLELIEDKPADIGVQDFCENCRLCMINCPVQALAEEKAVVRGYKRWLQDQNKCFNFWISGANTWACPVCMKICPWNKPKSFIHKINFFAARQSVVARRVLYWITIIFYGKRIYWKRVPLPEELEMPPETSTWGKQSNQLRIQSTAVQGEDRKK